jgi:hypothetical protein
LFEKENPSKETPAQQRMSAHHVDKPRIDEQLPAELTVALGNENEAELLVATNPIRVRLRTRGDSPTAPDSLVPLNLACSVSSPPA